MYFLYSGIRAHPIAFPMIMTMMNVSDARVKYPADDK